VLNADEGRLVQVVSNLLTNAAKYTQKHGRIQVLAERDGSSALLRVLDNGIGLHPDLLPRVFDRFTQGVRKSDRTDGGLGLGLSIVRNLVELHGGTVGAFSAGSGKGSEFVVRLPLARRARARARPPAQAKLKPVAKPRAILIVDDNRDIADVLAQLLRTRGHTVQVAYDAAAALALVEQFRPQFALLDIGLPAMDGYELAVRLRKRRGLSRMVLLAVTGYGQLSDRRRARRAGFAEHLTKPIDLPRLLSLIEGG